MIFYEFFSTRYYATTVVIRMVVGRELSRATVKMPPAPPAACGMVDGAGDYRPQPVITNHRPHWRGTSNSKTVTAKGAGPQGKDSVRASEFKFFCILVLRSEQRILYRPGSELGIGPVLVYCTDCTVCMPAVNSGPVTLCGPVALYRMH